MSTTGKAFARIGLMGNPSDGYGGKVLSATIANFYATVTLYPEDGSRIILEPHDQFDPTAFDSLEVLQQKTERHGYYGGLRLLRATCKRFADLASKAGVNIGRGFRMRYDTTIPVQVGLSGSSAIIVAALRALCSFYQIELSDLDVLQRIPNHVLSVEKDELEISAGLQDRVIQVYEGLMYMDFNLAQLQEFGYGKYMRLSCSNLPQLYLAWVRTPEFSGKVHSNLRARFEAREPAVMEAMRKFATFTDEARQLLSKDSDVAEELATLMDQNFELRRQLLGDSVVGKENLEMVSLARSLGFGCKFTGSGGAIVCVARPGIVVDEGSITAIFNDNGYHFTAVTVHYPSTLTGCT